MTSSSRVKPFVTPFLNENVTAFPFGVGIGETIVSRRYKIGMKQFV